MIVMVCLELVNFDCVEVVIFEVIWKVCVEGVIEVEC